MHAILFGIKRAFHSSVLVLRDILQPYELTPARYDLLFLVREREITWMSDVRKMLGVTAATVSRMVKSLVARGLVTLSRPDEDRRQRDITLTEKGEDCLSRALTLRQLGAIDLYVEDIFRSREAPTDDPIPGMQTLYERVADVRRACGDTSTDPDPWDPYDWDDEHITHEGLQEMEDVEPEDIGAEGPAGAPCDGEPL